MFLTLLFIISGVTVVAALTLLLRQPGLQALIAVSALTLLPRITSLIDEQNDVQRGVGLYLRPKHNPLAPLLDRLPPLPYPLLTNAALACTWLAIVAAGTRALHPALTLLPAALHLTLLSLRNAERNRAQARHYAAAQVCSPESYNDLELRYADTHRLSSDERRLLLTHRP